MKRRVVALDKAQRWATTAHTWEAPYGIVKLSEVGAVANHISLMRHI